MTRSKMPKGPHDHSAKHAQVARKGWRNRVKSLAATRHIFDAESR